MKLYIRKFNGQLIRCGDFQTLESAVEAADLFFKDYLEDACDINPLTSANIAKAGLEPAWHHYLDHTPPFYALFDVEPMAMREPVPVAVIVQEDELTEKDYYNATNVNPWSPPS